MKRIISVIIAAALLAAVIFWAVNFADPMYKGNDTRQQVDDTVVLWYTDDSLTDFLDDAAVTYRADTGVKIMPVLVDGVDYLQKINHASVYAGEVQDGETVVMPDMYITSHDNLMKAYYAGLASEITDPLKVNMQRKVCGISALL